jgi:alpha-amylase
MHRVHPLALLPLTLGLAACSGASEAPDAGVDAGTPDSGRPPPTSPNEDGWWRGAVGYEVFVRSFADSDGDGIGDFAGLTARLDYLNDGDPATQADLGVDAIWLMPIHPSPSYHGYDIADYRGLRAEYGTFEDFADFVDAAHARGMRVILDFVLNHSAKTHPWFESAATGPASEFRDYYVWRDADPGWKRSWDRRPVWFEETGAYYYGIFGELLPDLNLANPAVEDEVFESMRFWASKGVDGFRVDAARHLFESDDGQLADQPETHAFTQRMRERLHAEYPDVLLLAEAWIDVETLRDYWGEGYEYQLAFSFDVAASIKQALMSGDVAGLRGVLERSAAAYPDRGYEAPFLSNHDQERAMRTIGKDAASGRLAAATLLALPGTPFLYYGEELGAAGGSTPFDEDKRQPFRWTAEAPGFGFTSGTPWRPSTEDPGVDLASQREVPGSLWTLYRDLVALRHAHPALGDGAQQLVAVSGATDVLAWTRTRGAETILFVANFGADPTGPLTVEVAGAVTPLLGVVTTSSITGTDPLKLTGLPGRGFGFLTVE